MTQIPLAKAELLKVTEGDASADPANSVGRVQVPDETGFASDSVERQLLNDVIRGRLEETLQLVRDALPDDAFKRVKSGVFLTGGASRMRGFGELAKDVFQTAVYRPEPPDVSGVEAYYKDPKYSTVVGLLRYAQILEEERSMQKSGGFFSTLVRSVWPFGNS